jgi:hypothetical protein
MRLPNGLCCPVGSTAQTAGPKQRDLCRPPLNCLPSQKTTTGLCCPGGYKPQSDGTCVPKTTTICPPNELPGTGNQAGTCQPCPLGQGGLSKSNAPICCPVGTTGREFPGECLPSTPAPGVPCSPDRVTFLGWCCPYGYTPSLNGMCTPTPTTACPPGRSGPPDCLCPVGQAALGPGGACEPQGYCPADRKLPSGQCCPSGSVALSNGSCGTKLRLDTPKCDTGLVPRDAYRSDPVCVAPIVRDRTIADNIASPSRTQPNGSCIAGYVWREANSDDHVCVLPATREQTWSDNKRNCGDDRCQARAVPTENTGSEHTRPTTITEHPRRNILERHAPSRHEASSEPKINVHRRNFAPRVGGFHSGGSGFHFGGFGRRR